MLDKLFSFTGIQLMVGFVLFATWVSLVVFKVQGAEQIISLCQSALLLLVGHVTGSTRTYNPGPSVTINPPATGAPSHG